MRLVYALAACLALSACASSSPSVASGADTPPPTPASLAAAQVRQARVDSLLSLPPARLSQADVQWLQVYYQQREDEQRQQAAGDLGRTRRTVGGIQDVLVVVAALSVFAGIAYFIKATP